MIWIRSRDRMPVNHQRVWYYGELLGVWRGRFVIDKSERGLELTRKYGVPNTTFHCEESPGVCDTDDAPYWMPYEEGSEKPQPPEATLR